jgi:hypothetical protein
MEEIKTGGIVEQEKQEVQETEKQEVPKEEQKVVKEDLVSRVSKVKVEVKEETNPFNLTKEDYDKVQNDPNLSKFYKSMQSDYIKKTQQIAEERKGIEELKKQTLNWTPERLQQEINKPDFIQAAQRVMTLQNPSNSGLTQEEYSTLTDKEKAQLQNLNQQVSHLQLQNWQMLQRQQDEVLKQKYANYAPDIVDTTVNKLVKNEVNATREDLWKAIDYEAAVNRAYQLGKQDRALENTEKQQSISMEGFSATPLNEVPPPEKGESDKKYFKRLAERRLAEAKGLNK